MAFLRPWKTAVITMAGALAFLTACSAPAPETHTVAVTEPPPDQSSRFPQTGLLKMERIPNHLLEKKFMPGGNLGTYQAGKMEYQQFLGKMADADRAAFLLLDWQKELKGAKYLPHMGGYFGMDGDRPVYVFVKGAWVAGIVGLTEEKADVAARVFAARL